METATLIGNGRKNLACLVYWVCEINSKIFFLGRRVLFGWVISDRVVLHSSTYGIHILSSVSPLHRNLINHLGKFRHFNHYFKFILSFYAIDQNCSQYRIIHDATVGSCSPDCGRIFRFRALCSRGIQLSVSSFDDAAYRQLVCK
jgi:hypothetical protein